MATYLQIINDFGTVLIDDDFVQMAVLADGTAQIASGGSYAGGTFTGGSSYAKLAFTCTQYLRGSNSSAGWELFKPYGSTDVISAPWWTFDQPQDSGGGAKMKVWNSSGSLVFDSGCRYARVVGTITTLGAHTFPVGPTYAVAFLSNTFQRTVTWYHQGNNLYHYDIDRYMAFAKVVNNVVTVAKDKTQATQQYRDEPVGQVGVTGSYEDPKFLLLVLDVSNYSATSGTAHTVSASNISASVAAGAQTRTSTATVTGGVGPFLYQWSWASGTAPPGLSIISGATSATVTVQSTGDNQVRTGSLVCTVTDTSNGNLVANDEASVSFTHAASFANHTTDLASSYNYQAQNPGTVQKQITVTVANGSGNFAYAWSWSGTHAGLSIVAGATSATVTIESTGTDAFNTGTLVCTVTDLGNSNYVHADSGTVSVGHRPAFSVNANNISVSNQPANQYSFQTSTATVAGGVGPFTYGWQWVSINGDLSVYSGGSTSQVTVASYGAGTTNTGTLRIWVTDTGNNNEQTFDDISISVGHAAAIVNHTVNAGADINDSRLNAAVYYYPSATVTNGSGNFAYAWSWVGAHTGLTITSVTNQATIELQSNGTNQQNTGTLRCTVTDLSNGNYQTYDDMNVSVLHGSLVTNHTVFVSSINASHPNGTVYKYPSATVSNGVGPFTYSWSIVSGGAGMAITSATTGSTIELQCSGTNQQRTCTLRCTVVDTGNGNYSAYYDASVTITHGTPP